jgi:L,D-transpeptidase catalytic domain
MRKFFVLLFSLIILSHLAFAGRYYDARTGRFLQIDPKAEKGPNLSPYAYANCNPLKYIDPDGKWSINVVVNTDNRTATFYVYDKNGKYVTSYEAKAKGSSRDRLATNGDTPHGTYSIGDWMPAGENQSAKDKSSFGPNPRLVINPESGEAKEAADNDRGDFRVHGGDKNADGSLKSTHGCVRLSNDDMANLYSTTQTMEQNDSEEKPTTLTVKTVQQQQEVTPQRQDYQRTNEMVPAAN